MAVVRRLLSSSRPGVAAARRWSALVIALVPLLVSAATLIGVRWFPSGDIALLELVTRDIGHDAVLVGPYSRDGWHHLGPAVYYAFVGPYRLTGESSVSLLVTALAVNGISIAGMTVIARRFGGSSFMIATLLGLAVLVRSFGAEFLRSPWNPTITVLPFGLLVFLTWATACGSARALPLAAVVASFLVQTHVGYAPLALPVLAVGALWLSVDELGSRPADRGIAMTNPGHRRRRFWRCLAATGALLAVVWLPPAIDQIINDPGNLRSTFDYFQTTDLPTHSIRDGLDVVSPQFALAPDWVTGDRTTLVTGEPTSLEDPDVPALAVIVVAAATIVVKRGTPSARRYVLTVAIALGLGIVSIARTPGPLYMYRLDWAPLVGMLAFLATAMALPLAVPALTRRRLHAPALAAALVGLLGLTAINSVDAIRAKPPQTSLSNAVGDLAPDVRADLPRRDGQVVFGRGPDFIAGSVGRGLELNLERSGVWTVAGGEEDPDEPIRAEYLVATDDSAMRLLDDTNYELVATTGPAPGEPRPPGEHLIVIVRSVLD